MESGLTVLARETGTPVVLMTRAYTPKCVGPQNCSIYRGMVSALRDGRSKSDVYEDIHSCGRRKFCSRLELGLPEARD